MLKFLQQLGPNESRRQFLLLRSNPKPKASEIDKAMTGNLCRCGTYQRIRRAIQKAAGTEE